MEEKIKVLLAEDDRNLGTILKAYLEAKGFPTRLCVNGEEALEAFLEQSFDFCVLDVMMPIMDGFTLAKEIRTRNKQIPILFLTAKSLQEDKLKGFQVGADDYLTKPFSMDELLVRMQAILRRTAQLPGSGTGNNIFRFGIFTFDYNRQLLNNGVEDKKLTGKENELLRLLCENVNQVLDRGDALKEIWHDDSYFNARSMDVYVAKIRKHLKEDSSVELINVHGIGFKLVVNM